MFLRIVAVFVCLFASSSSLIAQDQVLNSPSVPDAKGSLISPVGRYVFGQISDYRKDQFMLDTETGRLWRLGTDKIGEATGVYFLVPIAYENFDGSLTSLPKNENRPFCPPPKR